MSAILSHCRGLLNALFAGEEPTNEQSYRYLTNDGDFKLQDDSHDMDPTTEKKNSTMSRAGDESTYGADTLERTMIRCGVEIYFIILRASKKTPVNQHFSPSECDTSTTSGPAIQSS